MNVKVIHAMNVEFVRILREVIRVLAEKGILGMGEKMDVVALLTTLNSQ